VDFLELNRSLNVTLQMGGSDQWGNIVSGVDLVRRVDQKAAFGLTTPLLTTASGGKMGKTAQGAVWLNAEQLSPFDYWQFWRNAEDGDVGKFMRLFTDLPLEQIAEFEALEGAGINDAKKALADAATTLLHGAEAAEQARQKSEAQFDRGEAQPLEMIDHVWDDAAEALSAAALVKAAGISSFKDANKSIANGEIRINGQKVTGSELYARGDIDPGHGAFLVQKGKKTSKLVRPV
jgi:tyrosyl-tRNA synthetase